MTAWNILIVLFAIGLSVATFNPLPLLLLAFLSSESDNANIEAAGAGWGCVLMVPTLLLGFMVLAILGFAIMGEAFMYGLLEVTP